MEVSELLTHMVTPLDLLMYVLNALLMAVGVVMSLLMKSAAARLNTLESANARLAEQHQALALTLATHHPTRTDLEKVTEQMRIIVQDALRPITTEMRLMREFGVPARGRARPEPHNDPEPGDA
jgi:hypothetical protein